MNRIPNNYYIPIVIAILFLIGINCVLIIHFGMPASQTIATSVSLLGIFMGFLATNLQLSKTTKVLVKNREYSKLQDEDNFLRQLIQNVRRLQNAVKELSSTPNEDLDFSLMDQLRERRDSIRDTISTSPSTKYVFDNGLMSKNEVEIYHKTYDDILEGYDVYDDKARDKWYQNKVFNNPNIFTAKDKQFINVEKLIVFGCYYATVQLVDRFNTQFREKYQSSDRNHLKINVINYVNQKQNLIILYQLDGILDLITTEIDSRHAILLKEKGKIDEQIPVEVD